MPKNMKKYYLKEEEFLDEFPGMGSLVANFLEDTWEPDFTCNDKVRSGRAYFRSIGGLQRLIFEEAVVYHDQDGFHSVEIILISSEREVSVRVLKSGGEFVVERIVDR